MTPAQRVSASLRYTRTMRWQGVGLAAAVIVMGGGLALFASDRGRSVPAEGGNPEQREVEDEGAADTRPDSIEAAVSTSGLVERWTVEVQDADGQSVSSASVIARLDGAERLGDGAECEFSNVQSGTWDVVVRAEGFFDTRRRIQLDAATTQRTVVRVTTTRTLSGEILDTRGEPVERQRIWLLPRGAAHPASASKRFELANATTSSIGRFSLPIHVGKTYRFSLGDAGTRSRATSDAFEVRPDAECEARWVVPASARLTVRVDGLDDEEVVHVKVVTDRIASAQSEVIQLTGPRDSDSFGTAKRSSDRPRPKPEVAEAQEESESDGDGEAQAPDAATTAYLEAERARVAASTEDDGVELLRLRVQAGREAVADELPTGKTLRFRLLRGRETFDVSVPFQPRASDDARLILTAASALPVGTPLPLRRRSCVGKIERAPESATALDAGFDVR